jgi:hypothetical protein
MLCATFLRRKANALAALVLASAVSMPMVCVAQSAYRVLNHWMIGGEGGWDYMTMDAAAHRLYLAHNETVDVVDTDTGKKVGARTKRELWVHQRWTRRRHCRVRSSLP